MSEDREELRARLLALEKAVDGLQRDLLQLRAGFTRGAPVQAPPAPQPVIEAEPAPQRPPPAAVKPRRLDLETLVGRYGMLALATLLALAAVGTFVGWAIAHGLLGPVPRVVLGLAAAAGIAVFGVRLRSRERSFGDSLLGLSLAIVHVCAWQAGPALHLVPPFAVRRYTLHEWPEKSVTSCSSSASNEGTSGGRESSIPPWPAQHNRSSMRGSIC